MRRFLGVAAAAGLALLAACGGGGGDGGGGGVPFNTTPIVYAGNSSAAVITATNAGTLVANLVSGGGSSTPTLSVAAKGQSASIGQVEVGHLASRAVRNSISPALTKEKSKRPSLSVSIDEPVDCDAGSGRISGTLSDSGIGTLTVRYDNCLLGDTSFTGLATLQVEGFDIGQLVITNGLLSFARLSARGPGESVEISGTIRVMTDLATNTETSTQNVVTLDNATGRMTKSEDLTVVDVYDNVLFPSSYVETVSGRIYDGAHGFVNITTLLPVSFGTLTQAFPDTGRVQLAGASASSVRVTGVSRSVVIVAVDSDGDANVDSVATMNWMDLAGPAGSDLDDADGDRMHNGWELAKGFNPNDASDAPVDADGDGASNVNEYIAGSDPRSATSTPEVTGLSLVASDAPDPATVGNNITYTLTVTNTGLVPASNVVVTDTLPVSVNLVSASASVGSCAGTGPVTCSLGTLSGFTTVVVTIAVSPTAEGVITNTATVTTTSVDLTPSDNTAITATTVGPLLLDLQPMIDAASDGSTLTIPPGQYLGGLNFGGKNITLRSSGGPQVTIIHGNLNTAVRMGPGGTIQGFTITGARAFFGAGIEVSGTGSRISGNIFDGNIALAGGYGAAIGGNVASPIIERNIFRNNTCGSNQSTSGAIVFVNGSSPVIVNNIFANNACRAINLTLPILTTPQIINNTFVGNLAAIHVGRLASQAAHVYRNNIIAENGVGLEVEFGTDADNPVWENNLVFNNTIDYHGTLGQTGMNGNISGDPKFVNPAGGDYKLQPNSPAIDAGTGTGAPTTDFDGVVPRPLDGDSNGSAIVDIGAFEALP